MILKLLLLVSPLLKRVNCLLFVQKFTFPLLSSVIEHFVAVRLLKIFSNHVLVVMITHDTVNRHFKLFCHYIRKVLCVL